MDKSATQPKFFAARSPVVFLGIACLFPIGATILDVLRHGLPFSSANIFAVQTAQPLHWVIDAFPLLVLFLTQMLTRTKQFSAASRTAGSGETNTTKLTQAVTELKADLAKQRRTEETLRASEEFYRNLVENANDGIATISLDGTLTSVNRGFELMLGRMREEIVGKHYSTILSISSLGLIEDRIRRFQAGEKLPSLCELELLHHNGSAIRVEARTRAIADKSGAAIGFQGVYRDISKRTAISSLAESDPASRAASRTNAQPSSSGGLGASSVSPKTAVPPWSQSPQHLETNTETHYPAGYSPLSRSTFATSTPRGPQDGESRVTGSPLLTSSAAISSSSFSVADSPTTQTLEVQSAPSASPQFRFTDAASTVSGPSGATASFSEPLAFSLGASPFTATADRHKKEDRQAKVVPFPTTSAQGAHTPPKLGSADSQQMLNLNEALDRVDGDRELLREMAGVFLDEYPLLLVTMQDALSHGNAQTLTYAVHTLKGSVANFAATNAFEAALKLEKIGRQGNLTQAKTALAELEAELARLAPLLTTLKMEAAA